MAPPGVQPIFWGWWKDQCNALHPEMLPWAQNPRNTLGRKTETRGWEQAILLLQCVIKIGIQTIQAGQKGTVVVPMLRNSMRHQHLPVTLTSTPHLHLHPGDPAREPRRQAAHENPPSPVATTGSHEWGRRWGATWPSAVAGDEQGLLCLSGTPASSEITAHPVSLESGMPDSDTFLGKQHLMSVHGRSGQPLPGQGWCCRTAAGGSVQGRRVPHPGRAPPRPSLSLGWVQYPDAPSSSPGMHMCNPTSGQALHANALPTTQQGWRSKYIKARL